MSVMELICHQTHPKPPVQHHLLFSFLTDMGRTFLFMVKHVRSRLGRIDVKAGRCPQDEGWQNCEVPSWFHSTKMPECSGWHGMGRGHTALLLVQPPAEEEGKSQQSPNV